MSLFGYLTRRRSTREERDRKLDRHWATILALLPALLSGWLVFGPRVFFVLGTTAFSALVTDSITAVVILRRGGRSWPRTILCCLGQVFLIHWLLAAMLITLSLPPDVPLWVCVLGGVFAGLIARLAERAAFPRVAAPALFVLVLLYLLPGTGLHRQEGPLLTERRLVSLDKLAALDHTPTIRNLLSIRSDDWHGADITGYSKVSKKTATGSTGELEPDAVSRATPIFADKKDRAEISIAETFFGYIPGTIGETNKLALLLGLLILVFSGYVPARLLWAVPAAVLVFSVPFIFGALPWAVSRTAEIDTKSLLFQVTGGGLLLSLFFLNSPDYRPRSGFGQLFHALLLGAFIALGRGLFGFDVTVFAMLICAVLWPVIDRWAVQFSGEPVLVIEESDEEYGQPESHTAETSQVRLRSASGRMAPVLQPRREAGSARSLPGSRGDGEPAGLPPGQEVSRMMKTVGTQIIVEARPDRNTADVGVLSEPTEETGKGTEKTGVETSRLEPGIPPADEPESTADEADEQKTGKDKKDEPGQQG